MKVKITQDHIDNGVPYTTSECALALAVTDATGKTADVGKGKLYLPGLTIRLPIKARKFVGAFDDGEPVSPTEIDFPELDSLSE